jgi:hypothetical protein
MKRLAFVVLMSSAPLAPTAKAGEETAAVSDLRIGALPTMLSELLNHSTLEEKS